MPETFRPGHALLVGVGADLPTTANDARGLADILRDPSRCAYPSDQVHLLTDEHATREHILTALDTLAQSTEPQSTVIIYFSGHGYQVASPTGEFYYLLPYGYDLNRLYQTAISSAEFTTRLQAIPAQKLLVLLDCCHAGGVSAAKAPGLQLAKAPLPPEARELLAAGRGRVLIASSQENELSFAGEPYSAFTLALVEALCGIGMAKQDGYVRVADLALHARQVVPGRTGDQQHPILHFEHADNFALAYYAGGGVEPKGLPFTGVPTVEPEPGTWTAIDQRGQTVHGPQTTITGGEQRVVLSGTTTFQGPTVIGGGHIDASVHDRHDVHIQAGGDVAHATEGGTARVVKVDIAGDVQNSTVITAGGDVHYTPLPKIPPPPGPARPPKVAEFVGRKAELTYYAERLKTSHLAVISGMAGTGKTALASVLARRVAKPDQIVWHSFHQDEGIEDVIRKLAGFLFWHGQKELWHTLEGARLSSGRPPPNRDLLDYLVQMIQGRGYLLCLDNFQLVDGDPQLAQFVQQLLGQETWFIIASRRLPPFVPATDFETLTGLSMKDAQTLLAQRGLLLADNSILELHKRTKGNAQLLVLAAAALQRSADPTRLIAQLSKSRGVKRYLRTVHESLTLDEKAVMSAVAVLLGYPGTRDAVEAILARGNVQETLDDLNALYLLSVTEGEPDEEYSQHDIVQAFYYDRLGQRDRRAMHRRAGVYYETEELDLLKAARHFQHAKEHERAAQLATTDIWAIINQGQTRALYLLLAQFTARQLDAIQWATVMITRGWVNAILGENQMARENYAKALSQLDTLPDSPTVRELKGRAYWGMGDSLEYESPKKALEPLHRGLEELAGASDRQAAALQIKIGSIQRVIGDFATALDALQRGLDLLPEELDQLHAIAQINLGIIYWKQGDVERGREHYLRALEISQQLNDYWRMVDIWLDLGIATEVAGNWAGAISEYREALDLARRLGSVRQQAALELVLGIVNTNQGNVKTAQRHLSTCIALADERNLNEILIASRSSLADLYLRQGKPEAAGPLLATAEQLALEIEANSHLPEIYRGWALVQLDLGQIQSALNYTTRSVDLTRELELVPEEGMSLRVQGQALLADSQQAAAMTAFEQSLALLADYDPYEAARTKMQWGLALASGEQADQRMPLLQEARTTFEKLGAQRDLVAVDKALCGML